MDGKYDCMQCCGGVDDVLSTLNAMVRSWWKICTYCV